MKAISIRFLALFLVLACSGPGRMDQPAERGIVLGLIAPFALNRPAVDGAVLAADEINAAGGISVGAERRRIELVIEDDESEPETAVSKALKLINRDGAVALLGVPRSLNAIPVGRIAEQHRIPLISTMSTHPETTAGKRYVFRLAFLDSLQGRVLADFAFDDLGVRRSAILIDATDPYNTYIAEVFKEAFEERGGRLAVFETFTETDQDFTGQLQKIADSGTELLFLPNHSEVVKLQARTARRLGFTGTFLGGDSWSHGIDAAVHPELRGSYFGDLWAPDNPDSRTTAFIEAYRARFQSAPTASAALSYDAVSMIAEAIADGGAEPEEIRLRLANLRGFNGVSGTISFKGSGDPERSVFIREFDQNGRLRLLKEVSP